MKVIDYFRRRTREEENLKNAVATLPTTENTTDLHIHYNELQAQLLNTVNGLPEHCRIVYQYKREQGLTNKEIASALQISVKTVEYHMNNALKIIRQQLADYQLK
jgi:RNA polymerase sigma factor (sigma-70 family)